MRQGKEVALFDLLPGRLIRAASQGGQGKQEMERFLQGPVPMWWINRAAQLPGRALHVGVIVWHRAAMLRGSEVALSADVYQANGLSLSGAKRALDALEQAGLVRVTHHHGKAPRVTLVKTKNASSPSCSPTPHIE